MRDREYRFGPKNILLLLLGALVVGRPVDVELVLLHDFVAEEGVGGGRGVVVAEVDEAVARGGGAALVLLVLLDSHADHSRSADAVAEGLQLGSLRAKGKIAHV